MTWLPLLLVAAALALAAAGYFSASRPPAAPVGKHAGASLPQPKPLKPFRLTDHRGAAFDLERLKGVWTLVFFGYTRCPDICPTAMITLAALFEQLQKEAPELLTDTRQAFVSVDPERDHSEALANYLLYFNPTFLGVTGTPEAIQGFARQLGAAFFKGAPPGATSQEIPPDNDLISHTSAIFLIDPQARLSGIFTGYDQAEALVAEYTRIRRAAPGGP